MIIHVLSDGNTNTVTYEGPRSRATDADHECDTAKFTRP